MSAHVTPWGLCLILFFASGCRSWQPIALDQLPAQWSQLRDDGTAVRLYVTDPSGVNQEGVVHIDVPQEAAPPRLYGKTLDQRSVTVWVDLRAVRRAEARRLDRSKTLAVALSTSLGGALVATLLGMYIAAAVAVGNGIPYN